MKTNIIGSVINTNVIGDIKSGRSPAPPEENITDALLMEDGTLFLMEDGSYFMLEDSPALQTFSMASTNTSTTTTKTRKTRSTASKKATITKKVDKSYWNF